MATYSCGWNLLCCHGPLCCSLYSTESYWAWTGSTLLSVHYIGPDYLLNLVFVICALSVFQLQLAGLFLFIFETFPLAALMFWQKLQDTEVNNACESLLALWCDCQCLSSLCVLHDTREQLQKGCFIWCLYYFVQPVFIVTCSMGPLFPLAFVNWGLIIFVLDTWTF